MTPRYQYRPLHDESERNGVHVPPRRLQGRQARRLAMALCATLVALMTFLFAFTWGSIPELPFIRSCHNRLDGYQCRPEISRHWGQYAPFFSVSSDIPAAPPAGCDITFAQILSRHGSRDPTFGRTIVYAALLERLRKDVTSFTGPYRFLKDFEYTLGSDQLTAFGQGEMFRSGQAFYQRYRSLANDSVPFVRASGQRRVIMSARNFTQGMRSAATADDAESAGSYPLAITVIPEGNGSNNTLSDGLCDAFERGPQSSIGDAAKQEWASIFVPPILERLNTDMPGANLETLDVLSLMDLCPFHTVASSTGVVSPFCGLFDIPEWISYSYYQSLSKYYGHGPGNPLGPTQGVGFVNELIARLTGEPVRDETSVNHTLDNDPRTFPIGGAHNLFADFSHDNDMTSIFAALGLYNNTQPLSNSSLTDPTAAEGYSAAWTVPFAARAYVEKMTCAGTEEQYVRVLVNDRVMPLEHCGGDAYGRCSLRGFIQSLDFARGGGRFKECFA